MNDQPDDREYFFNRRTDKAIVSKRITDKLSGQNLRIVSKIVDGAEGMRFGKVGEEHVIRVTDAGRYEIKATIIEDDRRIRVLTIQKYNRKSGPSDKFYFSFVGAEIEGFLEFIAAMRNVEMSDARKAHLTDQQINDLVLNRRQLSNIFAQHEETILEIARNADLQRDFVSIGYRRKQLERFERLLKEPDYFRAQLEHGGAPEAVWQRFFEANTWIFGYGLSFQFVTGLDQKKLEQVVAGHDVSGPGKRADALLKTRGALSSLCFLEIKRHDTALLETQAYRAGAWSPSRELVSGVTQVQATVQEAIERNARKLIPTRDDGSPTGEVLFNIMPRSYLVIGNLAQFTTTDGINEQKFRSFETYRRNTTRPEIITFDELLERARFIVDH